MSEKDEVLSQEEVDALINGVDQGQVDTTKTSSGISAKDLAHYDFNSHDHKVKGNLPVINEISEQFEKKYRVSLFNLVGKTTEVETIEADLLSYEEYSATIQTPSYIAIIKMGDLSGNAMIIIEPELLVAMVDNFFGATTQFNERAKKTDFSDTELRIAKLVMEKVISDFQKAWGLIESFEITLMGVETAIKMASVAKNDEPVITTKFKVFLDTGEGHIHFVYPYAMLEPIKHKLNFEPVVEAKEVDPTWKAQMYDNLLNSPIELVSKLNELNISLKQIMHLKEGDLIPIDSAEVVTIFAESYPKFKAKYGAMSGQNAVQIVNVIETK